MGVLHKLREDFLEIQRRVVRDYKNRRKANKVKFAIGDEAANVINTVVTLQDGNGQPIRYKGYVRAYLSSDSSGDVLEAAAPDVVAIGTKGTIFKSGGDSLVMFDFRTESDGKFDVNITHAGADTFYLNVVVDGVVFTSAAITFDATT